MRIISLNTYVSNLIWKALEARYNTNNSTKATISPEHCKPAKEVATISQGCGEPTKVATTSPERGQPAKEVATISQGRGEPTKVTIEPR